MPSAPSVPQRDYAAEEKARLDAERAAIAESKAGGRRSTIVGGEVIAAEEQYGKGLLGQQKRATSMSMGY